MEGLTKKSALEETSTPESKASMTASDIPHALDEELPVPRTNSGFRIPGLGYTTDDGGSSTLEETAKIDTAFSATDKINDKKTNPEHMVSPRPATSGASNASKSTSPINSNENQVHENEPLAEHQEESSTIPEPHTLPQGQGVASVSNPEPSSRLLNRLHNESSKFDQMIPPPAIGSEDSKMREVSPPATESILDPMAAVEQEAIPAGTSASVATTHPTELSQNAAAQQNGIQTEPSSELDTHQQFSKTGVSAPSIPLLAHESTSDAEVAYDSSPYSSSTDTSDDSSSSDDSDDSANDYELLDPAEQARLLMAEDGGGSDGEGAGNGKMPQVPKTLNEKPDVVVPKPDIIVTPEMQTIMLGQVENAIENLSLIKATVSGEYQVLEAGSLLCLEDRTVVGVIAETLGRVQQPFYSVAFTNVTDMAEVGMDKPGTKVLYVPQFAKTVFTQAIKGIKGSDASNLHDEEVDDDEMEFSDDEKEAEHKRSLKYKKEARKRERNDLPPVSSRNGDFHGGNKRGSRRKRQFEQGDSGQHLRNTHDANPTGADTELKYEDDDGPYTPLVRPTNMHEIGQAPPPMQSFGSQGYSRPSKGGRGGRGRGMRGRDGQSRGGQQAGHSLPPRPPMSNGQGSDSQQNGFPQLQQQQHHQPNTPQASHPQQNQQSFQQNQQNHANYPLQNSITPLSHSFSTSPLPTSNFQPNNPIQNYQHQPAAQTYQAGQQPPLPPPHHHHQQQQQNQMYQPFPYNTQNQHQPPSSQPQMSLYHQQYPQQSYHQQQPQQQQYQQQQRPPPHMPNIPPGAFINPAFFRAPPG